MLYVIIFLLALAPVLMIGALLMDLLLASAPRRGKWPYPPMPGKRRRRMRVLTPGGYLLEGTPERIVARLRKLPEAGIPEASEPTDAEALLQRLEADGRLLIQPRNL